MVLDVLPPKIATRIVFHQGGFHRRYGFWRRASGRSMHGHLRYLLHRSQIRQNLAIQVFNQLGYKGILGSGLLS